jgi:acetate kinase
MRRMTDDPAKKKEEFVSEISEAKSDAVRFEALGREIARIGRYVQDVAGPMRDLVSAKAAWLRIRLDPAANLGDGLRVSAADSPVAARVIPTNEELMIARHTLACLRS